MTKDDGEGSFAAMLRELKGRSGQSYSTLAKRLHVSTSTLHRYCNGDAVPAEFAPAERLGRLCGAKPDELVELHRRWILASAARSGKKRERDEAPEPETAPTPTPGAASEPEADTPQPDPAPVPETEAGTASASVPGGAAERQPEWARNAEAAPAATEPPLPEMFSTPPAVDPDETAAENAAYTVPHPADRNPDEDAARNAADPVPADRHRRPAARADEEAAENAAFTVTAKAPRKRRPVLITAAVAVTAALAVTAAYSFSGDGAANRVTTARDGDTQNGDREPGDGTPSATAKEKGPGKKADGKEEDGKDDGKKDASTPPGKDPSGGPSAGAGGGHSGGIPLTANVRPYVWGDELPCFQTFLINRPPENMPGTPPSGDTVGWARSLGGVDAEHSRIGVVVRGTEKEPVVLEALRAQVVGRGPALGWQHYNPSGGCGGGLTPSSYSIALDNTSPVVKPVPGEQAGKTVPAKPFPRTVSASDPEALAIRADAVSCDCSWYLELDWSSGKRSGTLRIDDGGRPFRTSGAASRTTYTYGGDPAKWWGDG
ncbi:helix-turn-helix domain-containing protein [Streptomyces catenulae]|uniref:Helix-turn-helix domain-containing protein n=1 Tax=Streptomyces catenulae TaxID=66875 RepID=A0ABV2Z7T9_9ACTN|nr:helix-turn-helix domain-containing protein [Streptomyces catenulae]